MSLEALHRLLIEKKLTLSTAESCTGGQVAAAITSLPGCSKYYLGSVIAYSNPLKVKILGVSEASLATYGAVSRETAAEMAAGIIRLTGSDYSLAVTGIAGPDGGTADKPVGTVWCAIGKRGEAPKTWVFRTSGTRGEVIRSSVNELIEKLYSQISKTDRP